jgi:hypothetical protein
VFNIIVQLFPQVSKMFAFVNGAIPVRSFTSSLASKAVAPARQARSVAVNTITMRRSASMPFANAPTATDQSVPGNADFDPFGLSDVFNPLFMQEAEIKVRIMRICCQQLWYLE